MPDPLIYMSMIELRLELRSAQKHTSGLANFDMIHKIPPDEIAADGVFVFIGLSPNSQLVRDLVDTDEAGFVLADTGMQTSVPGIFVAGDVRGGSTKQAASAAGEGAAAAIAIRRYVEQLSSGLRPSAVDAQAG